MNQKPSKHLTPEERQDKPGNIQKPIINELQHLFNTTEVSSEKERRAIIDKNLEEQKRFEYKDIHSPEDRAYIFSRFVSYPTEPAIVAHPLSKIIPNNIDTYLIKVTNNLKSNSEAKSIFLEGFLHFMLKDKIDSSESMYSILAFMSDYNRSADGDKHYENLYEIIKSKKLVNIKRFPNDECDMQSLLLKVIVSNFPSHEELEKIILEGIEEGVYPHYYYVLTLYYHLNDQKEKVKAIINNISEDKKGR